MTTTENRITVQVRKLDESEPAQLYNRYQGQSEPQPCYVSLDLRDGELTASWNGEIGNAVPFTVWHGVVRRYTIPPLRADAANRLLEEIAPVAQAVLDGATVEWDGSNMVGQLTESASLAEEEIERLHIERAEARDYEIIQVWDAADWLQEDDYESLGITPEMTDDDLEEIAEDIRANASAEGVELIENLIEYLQEKRDDCRLEVDNDR